MSKITVHNWKEVSNPAKDVTDPPGDPDPSTSWGAVIVYVNDEEYNTFVGPTLNAVRRVLVLAKDN